MQREFEAASGRLITNRSALELYCSDSKTFFNRYSLTPEEISSLLSAGEDLIGLNVEFVSKRESVLDGPAKRTLFLLGDYGDLLKGRYLDIYPPSDYFGDRVRFFEYLISAVTSSEQPKLVQDVVYMEYYWFLALNTILEGEGLEGEDLDFFESQLKEYEDPVLRIRKGVYFRDFNHNLTHFPELSLEEIKSLKEEPTSLIIHRRRQERSNIVMRVTPLVNRSLTEVDGIKRISGIVSKLATEIAEPTEELEIRFRTLANSFLLEDILVKVN